MTGLAGPRPGVHWGIPLAIASGLVALAARRPSAGDVVVVAVVGALGALAPLQPSQRSQTARLAWLPVVLLGTLPFLAFAAWSQPLPAGRGWLIAVLGVFAAAAEEVFFRRLVYGWLTRWGTAAAVVGSALLFAAVHLPVHGAAVLPVDFAAGLVFGWQRWASGGWTAPALTHALANLLALV